ncbi:MAG: hypothetical protein JW772_03205 [Candidatus Diapherotrites archaeon]|nr:hypothetical protein [Candidatus Diapherotrites archaeon]
MGVKRLARKAKHSLSVKGLVARRIAERGAVVADRGYYQEGIIPTAGKRTKNRAYLVKGSRELYKSGKDLVRDSEELKREAKGPMDRGMAGFEKAMGQANINTAVAMRHASMKQLKKQKKK